MFSIWSQGLRSHIALVSFAMAVVSSAVAVVSSAITRSLFLNIVFWKSYGFLSPNIGKILSELLMSGPIDRAPPTQYFEISDDFTLIPK